MRSRSINKYFTLLLLAMVCCVEPYVPEGVNQSPDFLVVDGSINASANLATVRLSKAVALNFNGTPPGVTDAAVSIESSTGDIHELYLAGGDFPDGTYSGYIPVDFGKKYKLRISLNFGSGKDYESDFIDILQAPQIETLSLKPESEALKILVTSATAEQDTRFYRWKFTETWEYSSIYSSSYILDGGTARVRTPDEEINRCYRTVPSSDILIASSQDLSANIIRNFEVHSVDRGSIRLSRRYSINVQQEALSEEAYAYWLSLYKTNENVGSLFDPMPGQATGNIKSLSNSTEVVIGFFSASTVYEKRIFVTPLDLPVDYSIYRPPYCLLDTIPVEDIPTTPEHVTLVSAVYAMGFPVIIAYTTTESQCVDCRALGNGTTVKPDFWP